MGKFFKEGAYIPGVTPAIGRVVTNLMKPVGYDLGSKLEHLKNHSVKDMVKAVIKDKPLYKLKGDAGKRDKVYREMFGLPSRTSKLDKKIYKPVVDPGTGKLKRLEFKPGSKEEMEIRHRIQAGTKERYKGKDINKLPPDVEYHSVMGGYSLTPQKGSMKYRDVWDIGLDKWEKESIKKHPIKHFFGKGDKGADISKNLASTAARALMGGVTKAPLIEGRVRPVGKAYRTMLKQEKNFVDNAIEEGKVIERGVERILTPKEIKKYEKQHTRIGDKLKTHNSVDRTLENSVRGSRATEYEEAYKIRKNTKPYVPKPLKKYHDTNKQYQLAKSNSESLKKIRKLKAKRNEEALKLTAKGTAGVAAGGAGVEAIA